MALRLIARSLTARRAARAHQRWQRAAWVVSTRWETFTGAEDQTRAFAFASYLAALDAEEAAAADIARLTPQRPASARRSILTPIRRSLTVPRFAAWLAIALASAFLVVASRAFGASTVQTLAWTVSIATLIVSVGIAYAYRRHAWTAVVAVPAAGVSAWTIVATLIYSSQTMQDLTFADSLALAGLALLGLTVHELSVERVVHSIQDDRDRHGTPMPAAA